LTFAQLDSLTRRYGEEKEWADFRVGLICSVIANVNRDPKKKSKAYQPQDFMPRGKKYPKKQTPEEFLTNLRLMNAAYGGREVEK
jgi:hypothetical protein